MLGNIKRHYRDIAKYKVVREKDRGVPKVKLVKEGNIKGVIVKRKYEKAELFDGTVVEQYGFMYTDPWLLSEGDVVADKLGYYRVLDIDDLMGKGPFVKYYVEKIDIGGVGIE